MSKSQNATEEEEDVLPENCRYVKVGHDEIAVRVNGDEDWLDEPEFEGCEIEPAPGLRRAEGQLRFEEGDQLPLDVAREVWSAFSDRLVALDGNHSLISRGANVAAADNDRIH